MTYSQGVGVQPTTPRDTPRRSSVTAQNSVDSKSSKSSKNLRLSGFKSSFTGLLRNTMLGRSPADVRANKLPTKGFFTPGEDDASMHSALKPSASTRSKSSTRSHLAARSLKSVYSIRAVHRHETTPNIFITQPTIYGRHSYAVHRGRSVARVPSPSGAGIRHVRYYHPSVTGIISPAIRAATASHSQETLLAPSIDTDRVSTISIPQTADIAKDFPGAVNIKQIAHDSELDFENAKATVDGLRPKTVLTARQPSHSALEEYLEERNFVDASETLSIISAGPALEPECAEHPTLLSTQSVRKHRHNALLSLCGGAETDIDCVYDELPASLTPRRQPYLRKSTASSSLVLAAGSATFFDNTDARKSYISITDSYRPADASNAVDQPQENRLQYLAYSRPFAIDEPTTDQHKSSPGLVEAAGRVDSAKAIELHQIYQRIEDLEAGLEEVNGSLVGSLKHATRVHSMVLDVSKETCLRPAGKARLVNITRPSKPARHSMNENGFPLLTASREPYVATPSYSKRTLSTEELKALQKEDRRKTTSGIGGKKKRCQHTDTPKKQQVQSDTSPLFGRMIAKLSFISGK